MKSQRGWTCVVAGLAMFIGGVSIEAHHAFTAEFDADKPVTIQGAITKMEWINPHSWLHIDVQGQDGKTASWVVELTAPNALYRRGWRKDMLPVGATVTVSGFQAKNGVPMVNGRDITMADGKKLFAGSAGGDAPAEQDPGK